MRRYRKDDSALLVLIVFNSFNSLIAIRDQIWIYFNQQRKKNLKDKTSSRTRHCNATHFIDDQTIDKTEYGHNKLRQLAIFRPHQPGKEPLLCVEVANQPTLSMWTISASNLNSYKLMMFDLAGMYYYLFFPFKFTIIKALQRSRAELHQLPSLPVPKCTKPVFFPQLS